MYEIVCRTNLDLTGVPRWPEHCPIAPFIGMYIRSWCGTHELKVCRVTLCINIHNDGKSGHHFVLELNR